MTRLTIACLAAAGLAAGAAAAWFAGGPAAAEAVSIRRFPWQVVVSIEKEDETSFCVGAIVNPRWVLTAAHCLDNGNDPASASPVLHIMFDATRFSGEGLWTRVEQTVIHPDYRAGVRENDLALVKLDVTLKGRGVLLPPERLNIPPGAPLEMASWGVADQDAAGSGSLYRIVLTYVDSAVCNDAGNFNGRVKLDMLCAGGREGGADICRIDRGGPLVWRTSSGPVLVGVALWTEGCERKLRYEVFTRVSAFRKWINSITAVDGS
jgi:secreted trypsin-like serine protease